MEASVIGISAIIITYNEEDHIDRCIRSLKNVADEIIVVDSFSTDKTETICRKLNVRFVQNPFEDYIQQKNYGASLTNFPYILSIDADEALSDTLRNSILSIKPSLEFDAYSFNRLNRVGDQWIRHGSWYPDRKIRLWKNSVGRWGGPTPHEVLILEKGTKVKKLDGDLFHYHARNTEDLKEKSRYYSSLWAANAFKNGVRPNKFYQFVKPFSAFFIEYILRGSFLAGYLGYQIAINAARTRYLKYKKLNKLYIKST